MKLKALVTRKFLLVITLITLLDVIYTGGVFGQVPPPPPPPPNGGSNNGHNQGGNQGAPSAPIGGGIEILLVLGALYSGKKIIALKKSKED